MGIYTAKNYIIKFAFNKNVYIAYIVLLYFKLIRQQFQLEVLFS